MSYCQLHTVLCLFSMWCDVTVTRLKDCSKNVMMFTIVMIYPNVPSKSRYWTLVIVSLLWKYYQCSPVIVPQCAWIIFGKEPMTFISQGTRLQSTPDCSCNRVFFKTKYIRGAQAVAWVPHSAHFCFLCPSTIRTQTCFFSGLAHSWCALFV